jgi:hypothetical protein
MPNEIFKTIVQISIPRTGTVAIMQVKSIHSLHSNPKHYAISSNVKIRRPDEDRKLVVI